MNFIDFVLRVFSQVPFKPTRFEINGYDYWVTKVSNGEVFFGHHRESNDYTNFKNNEQNAQLVIDRISISPMSMLRKSEMTFHIKVPTNE